MYTYIATALIALAIGFGSGWKTNGWRHDAAALAAQDQARETEKMRRQAVNTAATGHEADKERLRTEFVTITEKVEHEIQTERVVYATTCIAPGGLRELADAAAATGYRSVAGDPMPAASAPR